MQKRRQPFGTAPIGFSGQARRRVGSTASRRFDRIIAQLHFRRRPMPWQLPLGHKAQVCQSGSYQSNLLREAPPHQLELALGGDLGGLLKTVRARRGSYSAV